MDPQICLKTRFKFIDDNLLGPNPEHRAQKLYDQLGSLDLNFRCYLRVDQANERTIGLLTQCGCTHITFGIESGDDTVLRSMHRGYVASQIISGVNIAFDAGLTIRICIMVGFPPHESDLTISNTMKLIDKLRFHEFFVYPFLPYPKCDVSNHPLKYGVNYINPDYTDYLQIGRNRTSGYVFSTENYGPTEIRNWQNAISAHLSKNKIWLGDSNT